MKFKFPKGVEKNINLTPYKIDWNKAVSKPQKATKDFLYPFWKFDVVFEEVCFPLRTQASRSVRFDLLNLTRRTFLEVSPDATHLQLNEFMHGSKAGYQKRLMVDEFKREFAEKNGFIFIELNDEHLSDLTVKMFKEKFNYELV
jgi:hypothetical protein